MCQCDQKADATEADSYLERTMNDNRKMSAMVANKIEARKGYEDGMGKLTADREPSEFEREATQLDKVLEVLFMDIRELEGSLGPILSENYPTENDDPAERGVETEAARRLQVARHSAESSVKLVQNIKSRVRV